jgi:hypothetical protein
VVLLVTAAVAVEQLVEVLIFLRRLSDVHGHITYFFILIKKIFCAVKTKQNAVMNSSSTKETFLSKLVIHLHIDNIRMNEETIAFDSHPSRLALASTLLQSNQ